MSFNTDAGGTAINAKIKVFGSATTWNTRLSQIARVKGEVIICTYSFMDLDYIKQILDKRFKMVTIIANSKFQNEAQKLKNTYPTLRMLLSTKMHSKMVLIHPETVWITSANFWKSTNFESTVGIKSKEAYSVCMNQFLKFCKENLITEIKEVQTN